MDLPSPDTLAIRQLQIRRRSGGGADQRVPRATVTRLQQQLDSADWPDTGEAWVFIRSVSARGSARQLGERLTGATRERLRQPDGKEVVRFANLSELLAALIADLLTGQALQRWYWQRWKDLLGLPLRPALSGLLTGQVALLPSLVARLDQQGLLPRFMESLDEATAHQLAREIAWRGGFALPNGAQLARERERLAGTPLPDWLQRQRPLLVRRWQPALAAFPEQDACHGLALLLMGQSLAPLMLQRAPFTLLAQLQGLLMPRHDLGNRPDAVANTHVKAPANGTPASRSAASGASQIPAFAGDAVIVSGHSEAADVALTSAAPIPPGRPSTQTDTAPPATDLSVAKIPASDAVLAGRPTAPQGSGTGPAGSAVSAESPAATQRLQVAAAAPSPSRTGQADSPAFAATDFASVITRQGGLFYLFNFLNRREAQSLLGDYWEQLHNGWGWLYRLGQELQLDEGDPVVTLIAHQLGFASAAELDQLPPLPARADLLALTQRWYGRSGLWHNGLLQLQARIQVSPSHVDLYAGLNAVQLPVRLAGLDINPGWLPWLGKVVSFHYD